MTRVIRVAGAQIGAIQRADADLYLFVISNWTRSANVDLSPYAHVLALRKRVACRPAVQAAMKAEGL